MSKQDKDFVFLGLLFSGLMLFLAYLGNFHHIETMAEIQQCTQEQKK